MLFSVIIIVLLGLIAYFHFAQGLFAATVSAICAGIAALMAFSYHEAINARYTGGALASYGNAVMLCGLFALIYLVLRILIDNLIPGNVRYPVLMDKIGAAVMGVVAGFFATAIVAIAAQELPFGPTIAMYSAYPVEDVEMVVPRELSRMYGIAEGEDTYNRNQIVEIKRLDTDAAAEARQELWLPVDTWFIGLVAKLSDQGALAGEPLKHLPRNPRGIACFAFVIKKDGKVIHSGSGLAAEPMSEQATNNVAEYTALIKALEWLYENGHASSKVMVLGDSQLVVKQMAGEFRVKNKQIIPLFQKAALMRKKFADLTIAWVPREQNAEADRLSERAYNEAILKNPALLDKM